MSILRKLSKRSIAWLVPAILIPLAALLVMQYKFLRKLETTSVIAQKDRLKSVLSGVAADVETHFRTRADRALSIPPDLAGSTSTAEFTEHFNANQVDGAKYFFVKTFDPKKITYYHATGTPAGPLCSVEIKAVTLATASWVILGRDRPTLSNRPLIVDERDAKNRIILKAIVDRSARLAGVAGLILDESRVHKAVIRPAIDRNLAAYFPAPGDRSDIRINFEKAGSATLEVKKGPQFLRQNLGFIFTDWRLAIRDGCSPEELANYSFRIQMLWTVIVALVLLGAMLLMVRTAAREMKLSQMKSDFVSNVSHELRTPLSSIRVFGEYLKLGRVREHEKIREYGDYIETESRRLTQLINNILDFSKIESMEKKYRFAKSDLSDVVRQTVAAFETPLKKDGVEISLHLPAAGGPEVLIDRDAIAQVLMNLLDNAVKYSPVRNVIHVSLQMSDREAAISVKDSGIGIPPAEQSKIFEKFYRVSSGLVHDVKGSGLGLAIVAHVVRAHGGTVEVASKSGEGSTFTIHLPIGSPEPEMVKRSDIEGTLGARA